MNALMQTYLQAKENQKEGGPKKPATANKGQAVKKTEGSGMYGDILKIKSQLF